MFLGLSSVLISNVLSVFPAIIVSRSIDSVVVSLDNAEPFKGMDGLGTVLKALTFSLLVFGVSYIVVSLLKGLFTYFTRQTVIVMSRHIEYDIKNEIYNHYQKLPLSFYRKNNTGDLMNRISDDVSKVRMYLGPAVMYGFNLVVLFSVVIGIMLTTNLKLTLYTLLPLPILSLSIYYVSNKVNIQSEKIQTKLSDISTFVQEAFSGIRVLKAFARESESTKNFDVLSSEYREESLKLAKINAFFFPVISTLIGLSTIITVYVGGLEVIKGTLTLGNIAEFIMYVNMLTWPVTSLGWITSIVQRAEASQRRINEFLLVESDIKSDKNEVPEIQGKITFNNVNLTYPESGIEAIKDLSFTVNPGETLAILGRTGSGKSTLANLLCRMIDPINGKIMIDDHELSDINIQHYRNQIGYVPQEAFLFSDTIKNNIIFGKDLLTEDQLFQSTKDADVYDNIIDFPNQFDTILGERGITLSGGQKQRVTIARAIIKDPKILILDDCLSAVDTQTEDKILNNLETIMKGKTSVIISHRASTVKLADKILVLENGQVAEIGSHKELMSNNGIYKELYDAQLEEIN